MASSLHDVYEPPHDPNTSSGRSLAGVLLSSRSSRLPCLDAAVNRRAILVRPAAILPEDYRPADASGEQRVRPVHAACVVQSPLISGPVRQDDPVLWVEQRCRRLALPASEAVRGQQALDLVLRILPTIELM